MSDIKTSNSITIKNAKVQSVVKRVSNTFRLAAEKAVASQADPAAYPLPADTKSVERLFLKRFQNLPADRQKSAISKVMKTVTAPASSRSATDGDLTAVNLRSATSVLDQVRKLKFPAELRLSAGDVSAVSGSSKAKPVATHKTSSPVAAMTASRPPDHLELRIHKVKCSDDTSESGEDEISLGGSITDASGKTSKVSAFKVGEFKTGDVKEYSTYKTFGSYSLTNGTWPKTCYAVLVLAETDLLGGFSGFLDDLFSAVEKEVVTALSTAIGAAIGTGVGPLGTIIGAAVGLVVGEVFNWLKILVGDDILPLATVSAEMDSLDDRWSGERDSPEAVAKFEGFGGTYKVYYAWSLV